jgi:tetratricopeptide (TPR) repeat protein
VARPRRGPSPRPFPRTAGGGRSPVALALALALLACSAQARRVEAANDARRAGHPREALAGYQEVLGDLGEGRLPARDDALRLAALTHAADVSYLELGDFTQALSYYRRVVALYPGTPDAWRARAVLGDIYVERLRDREAAIAQWSELAKSDAPDAGAYQLRVAREYLAVKNYEQARTEARALRDRWPTSPLADDAQLLAGEAWALDGHPDEAQRALQALLDGGPAPEVAARALEAQAHLAAEDGRHERALELYSRALASHPNPESIQLAIAKVRARRDHSRTVKPGDRAAVFHAPH